MIAVTARFDGKVIVPDEPLNLPKGARLLVHIEATAKPNSRHKKTAVDRIADLAVEHQKKAEEFLLPIAVKAHCDGKVIVLDEPLRLPKGKPLVLHIEVGPSSDEVGKRSRTSKKKKPSLLEWAKKNAVLDDSLPRDLGHQHDHYLYGTPKKPPAKR